MCVCVCVCVWTKCEAKLLVKFILLHYISDSEMLRAGKRSARHSRKGIEETVRRLTIRIVLL